MKRENLKRANELNEALTACEFMLERIEDKTAIQVRLQKDMWSMETLDLTPAMYEMLTKDLKRKYEKDKSDIEKELEELQ